MVVSGVLESFSWLVGFSVIEVLLCVSVIGSLFLWVIF